VIDTSNLYLQQFAAMAATSECVKHAVLSLASSYVLDFEWSHKLLARANLHQKQCVNLIGRALNDLETYSPGNEDAVLAAIAILAHNDVHNSLLSFGRAITNSRLGSQPGCRSCFRSHTTLVESDGHS
jgi:hypothetical protein